MYHLLRHFKTNKNLKVLHENAKRDAFITRYFDLSWRDSWNSFNHFDKFQSDRPK